MRIGFGSTVLARGMMQGGVDGIGCYTRELMRCLMKSPEIRLKNFSYSGAVLSGSIDNLLDVGDFKRQALFALTMGINFGKMQKILADKVDLVHATDHLIPKLRGIPVVATLMDAIPLAHPEWVTYRFKQIQTEAWRRSAHWAQHIITISEYSRMDIARWFEIPEQRISVIPLGVDERWFAKPEPDILENVRSRYKLPSQFFLAIGTLQPRKNIRTLIEAHNLLPIALRREVPLVVVGKAGWGCDEVVMQLQSGDEGTMRWLQYVPDEDMLPILHQACALVFPSLYEGFGLPVLEAFAAQVPVIASNVTAIPEVAGSGAILVDPLVPGEWADAMCYLLKGEANIDIMKKNAFTRAKSFKWIDNSKMTEVAYSKFL